MKNLFKTFKMGTCLIVLPLVITAAASAHQWISGDADIKFSESVNVSIVANTTKVDGLRSFTIGADQDGNIHGRVVSIEPSDGSAVGIGKLSIRFMRDGQVVKETESNADGSFVMPGLIDGPYSFVATGESAYVAHGVNVSSQGGNLMFETAAMTNSMSQVRKILEATQFDHQVKDSTRKVSDQVVGANRVQLVNGELRGRVVSSSQSTLFPTKVHLFQGDAKVAEVVVDQNGEFKIENLNPGVFEVLVVGASGFAAASFETITSSGFDSLDGQTQVALQDGEVTPELNIMLVAPIFPVQQNDEIIYEESGIGFLGNQAGGFTGGGGGNFGGGGGGFGASGGQYGSVIGWAAFATGVVALSENDGNAPPATPFGL